MPSTQASACFYDPGNRFAISLKPGPKSSGDIERYLRKDAYSAAKDFVDGRIQVAGDMVEAIRFFMNARHSKVKSCWYAAVAHLNRVLSGLSAKTARNIQFHYDRSNDFYAQFLDPRMQYSSADYCAPDEPLEEAQERKLQQICQTLDLREGERFLDIGCGWGGLAIYAAEHFGVIATGCTLSRTQCEFALDLVRSKGLDGRVSILLQDYKTIAGRFDKIASVGMFEHVGRRRLIEYFSRVHALLDSAGLFLNRGIVRPEGSRDSAETLFLQEHVFPGGELEHLADVIRTSERVGFEVQSMKDIRKSYGLTCRAWAANLERTAGRCRELVRESTYRTWLLYLACSAVSFELGNTDAVQILLAKRPAPMPSPTIKSRFGRSALSNPLHDHSAA